MAFVIDGKSHCARRVASSERAMTSAIIDAVAETVGDRVRKAREARSLGNNELDRKLGKAAGWSSRLERGERARPRIDNLELVADALGVNLDWLARGDGPMDAAPRAEADDTIPERAAAVAFARANKLPEAAIQRVPGVVGLRGQRTPDQWYERIRVEAAEIGAGEPATEETFSKGRRR